MEFLNKYDAILFDVGNTLVLQNNPGLSFDELKVEVLPGVLGLLEKLSNKRLAIVSNSKVLNSAQILSKLAEVDLHKYFELCISSLDVGEEKPSPLPLQTALTQMKVSPDKALYVGDQLIDKQAALATGMDFIFTSKNISQSFSHFNNNVHSAWQRGLVNKIQDYELSANKTREILDSLIKPKGSLGKLEDLAIKISSIIGALPQIDPVAVCIFVADHGIAKDDSVTPWPQDITSLMADVISQGKAGVSALAETADVFIEVINVGTISTPKSKLVKDYKIGFSTKDFRVEPAMSENEIQAALEVGAENAERLVAGGSRALCIGEVGIGNTTSSAILISRFCKVDAELATGYGSGIPEETFQSKIKVVGDALERARIIHNPMDVLATFGGFEIAALVGFIIRATTLEVPVILDGVTTLAAAIVAGEIKPGIKNNLIAGHVSSEPASKIACKHLGLTPVLDLDLRLGEGTGAVLSVPIIRAACNVVKKMGKLQDYL